MIWADSCGMCVKLCSCPQLIHVCNGGRWARKLRPGNCAVFFSTARRCRRGKANGGNSVTDDHSLFAEAGLCQTRVAYVRRMRAAWLAFVDTCVLKAGFRGQERAAFVRSLRSNGINE